MKSFDGMENDSAVTTAPRLALELLISPRIFFHRMRRGPLPWNFGIGVYGASLAASSVFYAFKPEGFPSDSLSADIGRRSLPFWLGMNVIGFVLTGLIAAAIWLLLRFLEGSFRARLDQIFFVQIVTHAWYLSLVAALTLACLTGSENFFKFSEFVFSVIALVVTVTGLKIMARSTAPRVFVSMLLASLIVVACLYGLHFTGVVSSEMLKVLLII